MKLTEQQLEQLEKTIHFVKGGLMRHSWGEAPEPADVLALIHEVRRAREVQDSLQQILNHLAKKREHASDCLARFHPPSADNSEKGPCMCGAQTYNIWTAQIAGRLGRLAQAPETDGA